MGRHKSITADQQQEEPPEMGGSSCLCSINYHAHYEPQFLHKEIENQKENDI